MHKIPIQIRFSDIDKLGHVNNSIYNQYLDVARYDYLNKTINKHINWEKNTLVLVHVSNDFVAPTHLDDKIFVETETVKIGNKSVEMQQKIIDDKGKVRVKSKSILSTLNVIDNQSFEFPEEWRTVIEEFEEKRFEKSLK